MGLMLHLKSLRFLLKTLIPIVIKVRLLINGIKLILQCSLIVML